MIDTVKFSFPVKNVKNDLLYKLQGFTLGEKTFECHKSHFNVGSYDYNINISVINNVCFIEYSVPKFTRGYNVDDNDVSFNHLYSSASGIMAVLNNFFECPPVETWRVTKLDLCFNYYSSDSQILMLKLQKLEIMRKKKYVYDTSVMFKGATYSLKYYLKQPEYKIHDMGRIMKKSPDLAEKLYKHAENIVRFEITLRDKALQRFFEIRPVLLKYLLTQQSCEGIDTLVNQGLNRMHNIKMTNIDLKELLILKYGKNKGNRLYYFHVAMTAQLSRKLLTSSVSRTTIYRNRKLIDKVYEETAI